MKVDAESLSAWLGKHNSDSDTITLQPILAMAAMLDQDFSKISLGSSLPPLWHWLYLLNPAPQSELASDGHQKKGGFLPPVPLPRRMWAGSRLTFPGDIKVGDSIQRESTIRDIQIKQGKSGELVFVKVEHLVSNEELAIKEEHDIVYRAAVDNEGGPTELPPGKPAPEQYDFERIITADILLLFRYSALTFNAHRIHYDMDYVQREEGYPGLIVHGPLLATLLLELARKNNPSCRVSGYEFKALRPVFADQPFRLRGKMIGSSACELSIADRDGFLCMWAKSDFE